MTSRCERTGRAGEIAESLAKELKGHPLPSGVPLPSIRALSRTYKASPVTIQAALRELCGKGILRKSGTNRFKYYVRENSFSVHLPRGSRKEQIEEQFRSDTLTGAIASDLPLPGMKVLARRYSCGSETMRSVLKKMSEKGLIFREGRKYYVATYGCRRFRSPICVIGNAHHFLSTNELFWRLISSVEQETIRLEWPLANAVIKHWNIPGNPSAFICLSSRPEVLQRLRKDHPGIPRILIDPGDSVSDRQSQDSTGHNNLRIRIDHQAAGRLVASRLAQLGHRRIAVVGPFKPDLPWVQQRIRGISEIFPLHGEQPQSCAGRLFVEDVESVPLPPESETLERHAWRFRRELRQSKYLLWRMKYFIASPTYSMESLLKTAAGMKMILTRAFAFKETSAWICLNDEAAALAMHFLEQNGVSPGRDISVFGFDNSRLAYTMGISSYDFNYSGIGHVAVRWLERPSALGRPRNGEYVVNGYVVERKSTGAPLGK